MITLFCVHSLGSPYYFNLSTFFFQILDYNFILVEFFRFLIPFYFVCVIEILKTALLSWLYNFCLTAISVVWCCVLRLLLCYAVPRFIGHTDAVNDV